MFALINVGERSGSGLCDVYHVWEENEFKRPEILETVDPDRITLTLQIASDGTAPNNVRNLEGNVPNVGGNDRNPDVNLSVNEQKVLEMLRSAPASTAKQIAAVCGISEKTVTRLCKSLKEKRYIKREGSTRGKWIILK